IKIKDIFTHYKLNTDPDYTLLLFQIYKVWEEQTKEIKNANLDKIVALENYITWIIANIEYRGVGIERYQKIKETIQGQDEKTIAIINQLFSKVDGNRLHPNINQLGNTGRIFYGLQTLPKNTLFRSLVVPNDGYVFILADYSQFEARIAAGLSKDKTSIAIFQNGGDIYLRLANIITGKPESECTNFRKITKIIFLGLLNGMTEYGIQKELSKIEDISLDKIRELMKKIDTTFPDIRKWQDNEVKKALQLKYVTTPLGRRRSFESLIMESDAINKIKNFLLQGTSSDGFKLALCLIDKKLREQNLDAHIIHIVHDEIIIETKNDNQIISTVKDIMKTYMEGIFKKIVPDVPFVVEPKCVSCWDSNSTINEKQTDNRFEKSLEQI
ncbi:MAG: DNA polymerase, partial [bacterium]